MNKLYYGVLSGTLLLVSQAAVSATTVVELQTNLGTIMVTLDTVKAPNTVKNFLNYVNNGFYKSTLFHRVIKGFMIQGGGFDKVTGVQKTASTPIKLESNNGLTNLRGTIAMARTSALDSATSQFFINLVDNNFLNYSSTNPGYTVFGKVSTSASLAVVDKIGNGRTFNSQQTSYGDLPFTSQSSLVFIDNAYVSTLDTTISKTRIMLDGQGTVISLPTGINCGTACSLSSAVGGTVKLTAAAKTGYSFAGWRGDCQGIATSITLDTKKGNHNCTAVFVTAIPSVQ